MRFSAPSDITAEDILQFINEKYTKEDNETIILGTEWDIVVDINFYDEFKLERDPNRIILKAPVTVNVIDDNENIHEEVENYMTNMVITIESGSVASVKLEKYPTELEDEDNIEEEFYSEDSESVDSSNIWDLNKIANIRQYIFDLSK